MPPGLVPDVHGDRLGARFKSLRRPQKGSTGTYTGKGIKGPVVGSHFLHIDDFSKEVSKGCLLSSRFQSCSRHLQEYLQEMRYTSYCMPVRLSLSTWMFDRHCMCCCLAAASMENTQLATL